MNDCCLPSSQKLLVGALSRMFHLLREQNLAAPGNVGKEKDARWKNGQILGAYAWPIWSIPGLEPTTLARPTFPALLYSRLGACNGPASLSGQLLSQPRRIQKSTAQSQNEAWLQSAAQKFKNGFVFLYIWWKSRLLIKKILHKNIFLSTQCFTHLNSANFTFFKSLHF